MSQILYSDTLGESWEVGYTDEENKLSIDLVRCNDLGPFFALRETGVDGISILRSTDGQDWQGILDPLFAAGESASPAAITYDPIHDLLIMSYIGVSYVYALLHATQVDVLAANAATEAADEILTRGVPGYWQKIRDQTKTDGTPLTPVAYRSLVYHKKEVPA